jgi:hypothetical protein
MEDDVDNEFRKAKKGILFSIKNEMKFSLAKSAMKQDWFHSI